MNSSVMAALFILLVACQPTFEGIPVESDGPIMREEVKYAEEQLKEIRSQKQMFLLPLWI